ncbi:GNAT family N-acetyltransferase [Roseomonas aerophila]|uniref:GNAT family N-acetyltransferase n=1 Tax=Teichococcus aerophilus TaxID=1224513 RepID=A0ABR7RGS3_9PROT|nr:GNAT family N-acetyltransferase [Pseudoroseomonas aerophila]
MTGDVHFRLDPFELSLRDIAEVELAQLHALTVGVSWPHRAGDWQMLRELGQGLVLVDEIGRVVSSVMWWHYGPAFSMVGMLVTSPRLQEQGAGHWLMAEVHRRNPGRRLGLTATRAARRLYRSLHYGFGQEVWQCQGIAQRPPGSDADADDAGLRDMTPADLPSLLRLDQTAMGCDRSEVLARLLAESAGRVLEREGQVVAYALCRPFGRGHLVGPVIAATQQDAIAVTLPHVRAHEGRFLRVDVPATAKAFAAEIHLCGLPIYDSVTAMGLHGPPLPAPIPGEARRFALASQALG